MTLIDLHTHTNKSSHLAIFQQIDFHQAVPNSYFSVGIHPSLSDKETVHELSAMEEMLQNKNCIAIGEIGLDNRIPIEMTVQESLYIEQLKLAENYNLPIIIHCVGAWDRCQFLHSKHAAKQFLVYHGFSKPSILETINSNQMVYISLGQSLLHSKALQTAISQFPIERLFLETDTSEVDLNLLYTKLAELKKLSLHLVIDQLLLNFKHVFNAHELA